MLSLDLFWEEDEETHVAGDANYEHGEDHDPAHRKLDVSHQVVILPELRVDNVIFYSLGLCSPVGCPGAMSTSW